MIDLEDRLFGEPILKARIAQEIWKELKEIEYEDIKHNFDK